MLIDTHAHLNFKAFKDDCDEVIKRSLDNNTWLINIGSQFSTSQRAVEIANKYQEGVYAAVALHPIHLFPTIVDEEEAAFESRQEEFNSERYLNLAKSSPKVVAIGETGLDYFHLPESLAFEGVQSKQKQVFRQHLDLATELNLPVIIHCRNPKDNSKDTYQEIIVEIKDFAEQNQDKILRGVIHCFGADQETAKQFLDLGFLISFTGIVTFPNAQDVWGVAKAIPLEKIMVETDCPYLAPQPQRGKRNEPLYVKYVAEKIAELKGLSLEEVAKQSTQNALNLFNIKA